MSGAPTTAAGRAAMLLPMDIRCLAHLCEVGGRAPSIAIPRKLFKGDIPPDHPDLVSLGMIEHCEDDIVITAAGRAAFLAAEVEAA